MSIQWNKEVKMKDVKKFLNQEISLGEIDYHKCLQVSLMVVAFGIIPAFTYGTVLGTLEGQRIALMGEVSSLKAEVLSAKSSLASVSYFKARLSAASPVERTITTSNSIVTKDVVLGVVEITSSSTKRVLDRVTVLFADNAPVGTNQYYRNIRLIGADKTYTPDKVAKGYAVFTDVSVASTGEWSQFILKTDVAPQNEFKNGTVASTTFVVEQTKIVANKVFFLQKGGSVTNTSASYSLIDNGSNAINAATVNMKFTFNNTGDRDLYVDNTTALSLATSSTITTTAASKMSLAQFTPVPATIAGDTRFAYAIPAGTSRVFTVSGSMRNRTGVQGVQEFKITKIFYSDTLTNLKKSYIDFGLENLRVTPTI